MIFKVLWVLAAIAALELTAMFTVKRLRKGFQWLITPDDELPDLDREGLEKFIKHGYDPELGWVRKPDTWHPERGRYGETSYHIGPDGARCHPGLEDLGGAIVCFGDSFTFSRQVNDDETWPYQLSSVSGTKVLNFGVGNYGVDQALIRMRREMAGRKADVIIMGVVPSTIVRVLCVWKHYNEFGNTFGFKPRFDLKDGELTEVKNIIDSEDKLFNYKEYIGEIRANDYFYLTKFRSEMIRSPYLLHILKKPGRNLPLISLLLARNLFRMLGIRNAFLEDRPMMKIMEINKALRRKLFGQKAATDLLKGVIVKFAEEAERMGAKPVFLFMPQKDDVTFVREKGQYYGGFVRDMKKRMLTVDMTEHLIGRDDLDELYSDDNVYGGHYSRHGNRFVAETVHEALRNSGYPGRRKDEKEVYDHAG